MSVSTIVKNAAGLGGLGEGPHWDERSQSLMYVDIIAGVVHRWDSATGENSSKRLDGLVGFVIPRESSGYVIGLNNTISLFDWESGDVTTSHEVQSREVGFNDAKCDASGRLWAGTMVPFKDKKPPSGGIGKLFSIDKNKGVKLQLENVDISNGLAWTQDNTIMYYIDSAPRKVFAFDFDINEGTISNRRDVVDYEKCGTPETLGIPDGMCIDTEGKLWVACFGPGKVVRFDPETGKLLQEVQFPATEVTSCCFGGKNFDELYATSAALLYNEDDLKQTPLAGSTFKVTGLGVKGLPGNNYHG